MRLPVLSPILDAYAERFVRSIKEECLNQMVMLGEHHLRRTVADYTEHYHLERNHQGLDNELITEPTRIGASSGEVQRHKRLGGIELLL